MIDIHISFFYFGIILIFTSGIFYNPLVGTILTELTYTMIDSVAPALTLKANVKDSYTNSILYSVYGAPLLVFGLILVMKYRK